MRSIVITYFSVILAFDAVNSQYYWDQYNFGSRQNPQYSTNRNFQPNAYYSGQAPNSFYPQLSNPFYGQQLNNYQPATSYRFYQQQQEANSFYSQPSTTQPANINYQQPQPPQDNYQQQRSQFSNQRQNLRPTIRPPAQLNAESRVSERKCEEYLKMSQKSIPVSSLTLKPSYYNITTETCEKSQGLIINGENAKVGEFPHMAAVGYSDKYRVPHFICGGSLISDQHVLTAAHCRILDGFSSSLVRLGVLNLKVREQGSHEKDIGIESFISHEKYDANLKVNDIAVIKLVSKVTISKLVRPACLMAPNSQTNVEKAIVTGWGLTRAFTDNSADILQKAELRIKNINICRSFLDDDNIDNKQICAGDKKRDTCSGDSGGPLQIISPKNKCVHIIVGVTSYGSQYCGAENSVAVYVKVSAYLDWIEKKVWGIGSK